MGHPPRVQAALDLFRPGFRPKWHGGCAEPRCVSQALYAGVNPVGGQCRSANAVWCLTARRAPSCEMV